MKQFQNIFTIGVIVLLLLGFMAIQNATPSDTVDFRGEIRSVDVSSDGVITLRAVSNITGEFIFKIDDRSKLLNCCGEEITVKDLSNGYTVDINYRHSLIKEKTKTVKTLILYD